MINITIEVAYASETQQFLTSCQLPAGSTIGDAIRQSGVLTVFPELQGGNLQGGIFSEKKGLADTIKAGDRVEIYRSLKIDPKDARRARAAL